MQPLLPLSKASNISRGAVSSRQHSDWTGKLLSVCVCVCKCEGAEFCWGKEEKRRSHKPSLEALKTTQRLQNVERRQVTTNRLLSRAPENIQSERRGKPRANLYILGGSCSTRHGCVVLTVCIDRRVSHKAAREPDFDHARPAELNVTHRTGANHFSRRRRGELLAADGLYQLCIIPERVCLTTTALKSIIYPSYPQLRSIFWHIYDYIE